jgi:hypothetical protein
VKGRLGVLVTPSGITYHLSLFTFPALIRLRAVSFPVNMFGD